MASTTVTVGSTVGLHARPATLIAEAAANYDDEILLSIPGEDDEEGSDASSSLMIMALGAEHGDEVTVTSDNAEAVEAIAEMITKNLDEE
jgi:phosphocarrier protein HPr